MRKTITTLAATALAAAALTACGSSSGDGAATAANADTDRDTARLKLQECLRKEGIDVPAPGQGGGGASMRRLTTADRTKLQEALQGACKSLAQGAFGTMSDEQRQEFEDQMAKFSSCMRAQGVDVPTFAPGQPAATGGARRLDPDDPQVAKAMKACEDVRPQPPGGAGAGPGSAQ